MRIDITGRNTTVTPALRQLITKRLGALEKVLNDAAISALVIVTREKYRFRVEMALHTRGDHTLSGTAEDTTWALAVRKAGLKIEQQAKKLKGKWNDRKRQSAKVVRARKLAPDSMVEPPAAAEAPRVVRATRYPIKPMSIEDAAMQIDDTQDAFLVFRNADDDDGVAILYRRKDGNLGLIQP
jgi:putative sigma-54 modulation protein